MGIKVSLEHRTTYSFDRPVRVHPHVVRLRPAPHTRTTIEAYSMRVSPGNHWVNWQQDAFGNFLARLIFHEPTTELSIVVGLIADMDAINPFDFFVEEHAENFPFGGYAPQLAADLDPYLRPVDEDESGSGPGPLVRDWVRRHTPHDKPRTIEFLIAVNQALRHDGSYTIRMEPGVQSPEHTLRTGLGSCRDSAWLLVSMLREFGLAARFVSGYLIQLAQDVESLDGPSGPPADFTDLHAWTEVYLPGAGWVGLDPTSGLFAGEGHIPLAATPHPVSSAPITGATDPVSSTLDFSNTVRRIHEDLRVTLPYTDSQWERIRAAGAALDARTEAAGIGLTIGGEPTFVSLDDQTGPEWTTEADGPRKRERAADLADRLRRIYAPTGLVQYRQGKWYPGEPLPRWEIAMLWRDDGEPLWRNPDLLASPWLSPDQLVPADTGTRTAMPNTAGRADETSAAASGNPRTAPNDAVAHGNGAAGTGDDTAGAGGAAAGVGKGVGGRGNGAVVHGGDVRQRAEGVREHRIDLPEPRGQGDAPPRRGVRPGDRRATAYGPEGFPPGLAATAAAGSATATGSTAPADSAAVVDSAVAEGAVGPGSRVARAVISHIAAGLGLPDSQVRPAYEDALLRLAAQAAVPHGEPVRAEGDLEVGRDSLAERRAMLARLDTAVGEPAAYVLSLYRRDDEAGWASADWKLRRGRIMLTEGDSPAGLRLPLGSVTWNAPPPRPEADPFAPRLPFSPDEPSAVVESAERAPITAVVAEVRDGLLHVFLPPIGEFGAYCDLVRRVEDAVAAAGVPVVLEGYPPPADGRLHALSLAPDPGVIEVNVQPTTGFTEQSELLDTLYEQARLARLSTESFDVDGTDRGTGGGNHITLGGRTPARSPLLRRPDLLVSMLTYWQRHPALSYLFSGRFVGPTSQAPRVDEGREDALYELEIAFAEIARLSRDASENAYPAAESPAGEHPAPPWAVDRALRHLLTDLTGNTHRAEFCIDKLYSPDSVRGRLGLVELRGFEMPPHFRMAMVQSLLVRALVLRFWERPYTAPLIRHGANLHGRYLLPHFLQADIAEVAADLRSHGIEFDTSWLDPFSEFRFPRFGTVVLGDMEVELRGAIEPWNTLGEQTTASGTARYVDSSVERLQVKVTGADRDRYVVTCNGFPLPLVAAGRADVQVAGVRYRAWQPPESLHPTITVDAPLAFDIIERETGLSRGGCTYHVSHPGGMFYAGPPVNSVVAQSRRNRRFEASGHTPGPVDLADLRAKMAIQATDVGAPGILDLRRARTVWGIVGDR
ncbi:transglutaminase family protein [Nocardia seriolae]|uniref:transglutaminase family protein n=1 Tax=Nocardia seriolae TaxID=37332 RepID=UPI00051A3BCC|nr:transglutaminase family protein [Nocardia seriolae]MTJ60294.1 transglutaminase [Nocardia seriolae]MTJ75477.1 transglutaminase [Nocardia seriolae]MTJ85284.1 transglutaminase [Nocardia seriolae]MTK29280.1 transglutaminase [Nocardia seriolae]MTK38224.1 transglutaminase [Nocardia seriolae]